MFSEAPCFLHVPSSSLPVLCLWAVILLFPLATEDFLQAKQVYKEALKQAQQKGDVASVQHIQEELAELAKRRKGSK